jgi:hypothetical protein
MWDADGIAANKCVWLSDSIVRDRGTSALGRYRARPALLRRAAYATNTMWPELSRSMSDLLVRADLELAKADVYSVTYGIFTPPSGVKNDYLSLGINACRTASEPGMVLCFLSRW